MLLDELLEPRLTLEDEPVLRVTVAELPAVRGAGPAVAVRVEPALPAVRGALPVLVAVRGELPAWPAPVRMLLLPNVRSERPTGVALVAVRVDPAPAAVRGDPAPGAVRPVPAVR